MQSKRKKNREKVKDEKEKKRVEKRKNLVKKEKNYIKMTSNFHCKYKQFFVTSLLLSLQSRISSTHVLSLIYKQIHLFSPSMSSKFIKGYQK